MSDSGGGHRPTGDDPGSNPDDDATADHHTEDASPPGDVDPSSAGEGDDSIAEDAAAGCGAGDAADAAADDTGRDTADAAADTADVTRRDDGAADATGDFDDGDALVGPRHRAPREPVRMVVRGLGQLLITLGLVVLLFVVYELWVTNLFGEHKQAAATKELNELWASENSTVVDPGDPVVVTKSGGEVVTTAAGPTLEPGERTRRYDTTEGAGFAKMYIPSFGADFVLTVVEGTNQHDLYAGPGHYEGTQYPGQQGNFSLAGHRVNKGAPFDDLGLLNSCDAIVMETRTEWYVYRVLPMKDEVSDWADTKHAHCAGVDVQTGRYAGVYGREITSPSDYAQVLPVPHVNSKVVPKGAESLITLTTCHPKFSDRQRMIIHGILVDHYPKKDGFAPKQLQETS